MTTIHVTQEDIEGAHRCNSSKCIIARALERTTGVPYGVSVVNPCDNEQQWYARLNNTQVVYLPFIAGEAARLFDCGVHIAPFSFDIDLDNLHDYPI
jgi:hypothetical protein